jgi:hypothetical protein
LFVAVAVVSSFVGAPLVGALLLPLFLLLKPPALLGDAVSSSFVRATYMSPVPFLLLAVSRSAAFDSSHAAQARGSISPEITFFFFFFFFTPLPRLP